MVRDYSAVMDSAPRDKDIQILSELIHRQHEAEIEVTRAEDAFKQAKETLREYQERQIPEIMQRMGVRSFQTSDGLYVGISKFYRASPPVDQRNAAWDWLDKNGHSALIKRQVSVAFTRKQEEDARALVAELEAKFPNVKEERKVEAQTLKSWVKKMFEAGTSFPVDVFGAAELERAKIKVISQ